MEDDLEVLLRILIAYAPRLATGEILQMAQDEIDEVRLLIKKLGEA